MADRPNSARPTARGLSLAVDVVLLTPRGSELAVLLAPAGGAAHPRDRWTLPTDMLRPDETLDAAATRIARDVSGAAPSLLDQAGAIGGAKKPLEGPNVAVTYFGLVPDASGARRSA